MTVRYKEVFLFEKNNQKTFIRFGGHPCLLEKRQAGRICKSFLLLFFKKEESSTLATLP
jgi:hypothetical protein